MKTFKLTTEELDEAMNGINRMNCEQAEQLTGLTGDRAVYVEQRLAERRQLWAKLYDICQMARRRKTRLSVEVA